MEVSIAWTYALKLSKAEWILISKALRGALRPEDASDAAELQKKMVREKAAILEQALGEASKAVRNVEAAESASVERLDLDPIFGARAK